jgi:hypothetical protein
VNLDEARQHIGDRVIYTSSFDTYDFGTIYRVDDRWVFVDYNGSIKATHSYDLTLDTR